MAWTEGDLVGPYQVVRLLGRGGMGEVFEAIDVRSQTAVAIKVARRPLAAAADRVRFLDEGRIDLFIEELPDRPGADVRSARHQ